MAETASPLALVLSGTFDEPVVTEKKSITKERDAAIAAFADTPKILRTPKDVEKAAALHKAMRGVIKTVETAEKALKEHPNRLKNAIQTKANEFLRDIREAATQLQGAINNFQTRQLEAQKTLVAQAQSEAASKAGRVEALNSELADIGNKLAGKITAAKREELEDRALEIQLEISSIEVAVTNAALTVPGKIKGVSGGETWDFELIGNTDEERHRSLVAFCIAFPEMCNIEIRWRDVIHRLNKGDKFRTTFPEEAQIPPDYVPKPPGLRVYKTVNTRLR